MRVHRSRRLFVTIAFLIGHAAVASAQSFHWARGADGPCAPPCSGLFHQGSAIAADADGNTLATGRVNGTATFGAGEPNETTLTSEGISAFVAKYDVNGSLVWVRQALGDPQAQGIAVDAAGNSYVAGGFRFAAVFPGVTLLGPESGAGDFFIAKYDADGSFVWARQGGALFVPDLPGSAATTLAVAVDSAGNSRVTGGFGTPTGGSGFFVASYDASGSRVWIRTATGDDLNPGSATGTGTSLDAAGNTYVIGDLYGAVTFGLGEPGQTTLIGSSLFTSDFFIAKYDVNGAFVWARRTGSLGDDHGAGIAADAAGNVHITGAIDGTVTFGADEPGEVTFNAISTDLFVARYDSSGSLQWARHVPGLGLGGGAAIALDGIGGIHVAGAFVAAITFGLGEATETVLAVDPGGSTNPFVAKYNSDGSFAWARSAGGALVAVAFSVAAHPTGTSITGYFRDFGLASLTFGAGEPNATTLTTLGQAIFVARYRNGTPPANRPPIANAGGDQIVPVGTTVTLDGSGSSDPDLDPLTYQWTLTVRPPGSNAVLQNPTAVNPTFVADVRGAYAVDLVVDDGRATGGPDTVFVTAANRRPIADAGADQTAQTGATIHLNGTSSSDPDGDTLTFAWSLTVPPGSNAVLSDPSSATPTFAADRPGLYVAQLVVSDGQLSSAPDTVTIAVNDPQPVTFPCGGIISGTIAAAGEVDVYTFNGRAGQIISLALASAGGFASLPTSRSVIATVFAPSGATVGPTLVSNSQSLFTLPVNGEYTIRVRARDGRLTGSYNISGECLSPFRSADAVPIACGGLVGGTIGAPGQTDLFTFEGRAGQIISLALASTGGFNSLPTSRSAALTVFSAAGAVVGPTLLSNSQSLYTLPADGVYAMRVSADRLAVTGSYNVGLQCLFPLLSPDAKPLACGGLASGTITAPGDTDLLTFAGQAGQIISLALASTGGFTSLPTTRSAALTLFAPSGAAVGPTLLSNGQSLYTLPVSGVYVMRVGADRLAVTGTYNVSLQCLFPVSSPDAKPLACGALAPGTITAPGDTDLFTFSGGAGQLTSLALTSTTDFATRPNRRSAALTVFSATGATVGATVLSNGQVQITLPATGDYTARVSANDLATVGSYTVRRACQ